MKRYLYIIILIILVELISCSHAKKINMHTGDNILHALRLKPGEDLRNSIQKYVDDNHIQAGWMTTCAGSLTDYTIRFADQPAGTKGTGHFEIVSLTGTLSINGSHIHISISDSTGKTIGGHLLEGCKIYTTAEIIIGESKKLVFKRQKDGTTPWDELQIEKKD
jgi:predicted DNA-binding protein with PD1-like motif